MKILRLVSTVIILLSSIPCGAQSANDTKNSVAQCRAIAQSVMDRIAAGDDRAAFDLIQPHIKIGEEKFKESRDRTLAQRRTLTTNFGRVRGVSMVREERVSDFLYRLTYVEKREIHLIRWQFTFYRSGADWQLNSYNWDDNVAALFDR